MTDKQEQKTELIRLTVQDLRRIKEDARKQYLYAAKPNDYESDDFITNCYLKGVVAFLNKKGVNIDIQILNERTYQDPIE